ncbi:CAP domain-containing protein [Pseudonocardiaceae bacterium YIM PH 21723]|nr:CAP domain-containing protein [Pseudonocardiaceae bacterium YIM PH 21723]
MFASGDSPQAGMRPVPLAIGIGLLVLGTLAVLFSSADEPDRLSAAAPTSSVTRSTPVSVPPSPQPTESADPALPPPLKVVKREPGLPLPLDNPESMRQALLRINEERGKAGCRPLHDDQTLGAVARAQATDMATHRRVSHIDSAGRTAAQRAKDGGYPGAVGENLAGGASTDTIAVDGWLEQPLQRANMLDCAWTNGGVGVAPGGGYWTLMLGR